MAFRGQYEHSLDVKDRITVPARYRAALADGVVLAPGAEPCVEVYSDEAFAKLESGFLAELNPLDPKARRLQRRFGSRSEEEKLDSAGRVRLSRRLIEYGGLEGGCVIAGVRDHLEIWNPERWAAENEAIDAEMEDVFGGGGAAAGAE